MKSASSGRTCRTRAAATRSPRCSAPGAGIHRHRGASRAADQDGKLRGYAILGAERSRFAPEYPTAKELGYPELQFELWFGLMTSSKVPAPVLARLNAEVNKALQSPDLREKMAQQFYDPIGGTPERFAQAIRADMDRYGRAIKEAGIKPE